VKIGIPQEIKSGETRVAVAPEGVATLVRGGHEVLVQRGAGRRSGWPDTEYRQAGAKLLSSLKEVFRRATLICKVKEPQAEEVRLLRKDQILFTFLHLGGNPRLLKALVKKKIIGISYDTVQTKQGDLPILAPMSEVAGRVATELGAKFSKGTRGTVGVIGCGHVGRGAIAAARHLGAHILAVDKDRKKLQRLKQKYRSHLQTFTSDRPTLLKVICNSDLVIGAVLVPARRAPEVISAAMVKKMQPGSVIVDVAIDQGGCVATSRPTSIEKPFFKKYGVLHCAIPNLPALDPRTASPLLAAAVLPYLKKIADFGWEGAARRDSAIKKGLNLVQGRVVHPALK